MNDDGEIFSCDLTHNGKDAQDLYPARTGPKAISAITPFNHPLNMVSHKIAPSIATNNCMVCKPTELTPLTCDRAGRYPLRGRAAARDVPGGDRGWPQDIGDEMITNENIDIITFTGGVPVGKMIASKGRLQAPGAGTWRERSADRAE